MATETDLSTLVESLKRAVAVPGAFAATFSSADDDLAAALADGFAEAQLDGFFTPTYGGVDFQLDANTSAVAPALTNAQGALVVIYAASRFVYAYLLNLKNRQKFAAKGADYDTEQSASILTALLKQMNERKSALQQKALYSGYAAAFHMADGYFLAATQMYPNGYGYDPYSNADPAGF